MARDRYQLFDSLSPEEFAALEKDCCDRGILVPVEVDENGDILDGHNRAKIAKEHGLEFKTIKRSFKTEAEKQIHVLMLNMARRHLKAHQWGSAFSRLLELRGIETGQGKRNDQTSATVAEVAAELGVPERTARQRLELADGYEALPETEKDAVASGEVSVASAVRKQKQKKKRKAAAKTATLTGKFSVLVADPPWRYGASSVTGGADQHYATMATKEICAMGEDKPWEIKKHVTKDAVLFLWATNPLLPDALEVISAWGFKYKTNIVWVKDKATSGLGEYVRGRHELLLIATRGSMIPDKGERPDSVLEEPKDKHSAKPDQSYAIIESMYPGQKYGEIFSRKSREGWEAYGAEAKH